MFEDEIKPVEVKESSSVEKLQKSANNPTSKKGTFGGGFAFGILLAIFSALGGFVAGPFPGIVSIIVIFILLIIKGLKHFYGVIVGYLTMILISIIFFFSLVSQI